MLIKEADDRSGDIADLKRLLAEPTLTPIQRKNIQNQISNLGKGAWGEQQATYFLDFHFAGYKNTIILHDLRLVLSNGKTAQIDHLIINRLLDIYVLESKNWVSLTVDEAGACTVKEKRTIIGVESPLEQCKRHASVLERTFQVDPRLRALAPRQNMVCKVLVAPSCHLVAPHHHEYFVKADAFHTAWEKDIENESIVKGVMSITRMVSRETLMKIGEGLVELHNPGQIDWRAKFGLPAIPEINALPNKVVSSIDGLTPYVPEWGEDWFVLKGKPTEEAKKKIKAAGYRASQENGEWVWRLKV